MEKLAYRIYDYLKYRPTLIFGLIILLSLTFRSIFPGNVPASFDQIQILKSAHQILNFDLSLIGPRTGPASMFTGPFIYYLSVPFVYLFGNFNTIVLVPLFISFVTGTTLYLITKKYLGLKKALGIILVWAVSPFIVNLDRVFWNPNLILLSTFLILIPLLQEKIDKLTCISLFIGGFLSYQAHFSGFILIPLAIFSIFYLKRSAKLILAVLTGLLFSLTPTIIFDLRNNFLNLNGLIQLVSAKGSINPLFILKDFGHNLFILIETLGKLFLFNNNIQILILIGTALLISGLLYSSTTRDQKLHFFWLAIIAIAYSFYGDQKPEYYFLIGLPSLIFLSLDLFNLINSKLQTILVGFFILNSTITNLGLYKNSLGLNLGNIKEIHSLLEGRQIKEIVYDVPYGSEFGAKYLLSDLSLYDQGEVIHIGHPNNLEFGGIQKISDIAVWSDPRKGSYNYITASNYIIQTNPDYFLYKDIYPQSSTLDFDLYKIVTQNQIVGQLSIARQNKDKLDWVKTCLDQKDNKVFEWVKTPENSYVKSIINHCLLLDSSNSKELVNRIELNVF